MRFEFQIAGGSSPFNICITKGGSFVSRAGNREIGDIRLERLAHNVRTTSVFRARQLRKQQQHAKTTRATTSTKTMANY